jgi:hypothetical protein
MTMLTFTRGPFERARATPRNRRSTGIGRAAAYLPTIRRFCLGVVTILVAWIALAAIMAVKVIAYLPHFHH